MTITYHLDEQDYIDYQMYSATKSERIMKKRLRTRVLMPIAYLALASLFFFRRDNPIGLTFMGIAILWYIGRPMLDKTRFEKHYRNYVNKHYKESLNSQVQLTISDEYLLGKEQGIENKIALTEVSEITELPNIIILKLRGGQAIILPKRTIEQPDELIILLKEHANSLGIDYANEEKWVWK